MQYIDMEKHTWITEGFEMALRALVKELAPTPLAQDFLAALPHRYYEENNLHSFLIAGIKDYDAALAAVEAFLPFVDNWAVCDGLSPQVFGPRCWHPSAGGWLPRIRTPCGSVSGC